VRTGVKRLFDIVASSVLLAIAWPFMLLTLIGIWLEEGVRAPILYRQSRVGLNGVPYDVLKFRSMRIDAERLGEAKFAEQDDPRITRVGHWIRRTRIDELPQLINILKGEMAFVGPRPERPCWVQQFSKEIPSYAERHRVKPGLTGWAQLNYPYGCGTNDARRKLEYDLYYVKNHSILLDLLTLIRTVEVVLVGKGVR
jgi:lipopolysaccharide/colanic/teichoic acid biosynthesis glycosyltransferase